jgi:D-aminoacyl-tRNA deacylase
MFKKYLIIASKLDKAGMNITAQLSQFRKNPVLTSMNNSSNFDFYLCEKEIIYTENLDLNKINQYDFIIFASKHESIKKQKTLSIHAPGNWRRNELGGETGKICKTSALFQKQIFEKLNKNAKEHNIEDYKITLECTHHGPLIDKPCIFIEIGATETEWQDRRAGFVIAKTIRDIIQEFKENPYNEIAVGIGGPHYCPNFNKIQLNSNVALSHIIPQYVLPLTQEMIQEAINKTQEEVDFVLLDWKGLGNSEQRQQILNLLDKNYINYKKTSEVNK